MELWFTAAGRPRELEVRDDEHPLIPGWVLDYVDRGYPRYDPPAEETALLGYEQGVLIPMVDECYRYYSSL